MSLLNRRAAAIALVGLFGSAGLPTRATVPAGEATAGGDDPFSLGVASGMPRPDSVVLWTRLAPRPYEPRGGLPDAPITVLWELADDERFGAGLRRGSFVALPEHGHAVHVEVPGLRSDSRYFYRFMVGDAVSPVGRTRTAPADDADVARLRLALASCQHYEQGHFAAQREIAAQDLDFVLFVGDYIYESSNRSHRIRLHEGPVPRNLAGYRARHATYKLDAGLRAAHAAHPWILTWDDHEVENDYANDLSRSGMDPQAFLRRRAAAYKAYFEHLPVSPSMAPRGPSMRIHAQFAWGRLAALWTLDTRQHRASQACADGRRGGRVLDPDCAELADESRSMLGGAQEDWLAQGLAANQRQWKLIAQGSQISPGGIGTPIGRRVYSDGWDGYPAARERLMQTIAERGTRDVLCLGGDVHRHVAAQLRLRPQDMDSPVVASEFVASSLTTRGLASPVTALIKAANPDMLHARSDERGYALIEIDRMRAQCSFRSTAYPVVEASRLQTQARFSVESGTAGVQS